MDKLGRGRTLPPEERVESCTFVQADWHTNLISLIAINHTLYDVCDGIGEFFE